MSLINSDVIPASATAYEIEQSLRFNETDSSRLSINLGTATDTKISTFSAWVKRADLNAGGEDNSLFRAIGSTGYEGTVNFNTSGQLRVYQHDVGQSTNRVNYTSTALFRDPSAWYHIMVVFDTTDATQSNRFKVYVNGTQQTDTSNTFSQNETVYWNSIAQGQTHYIGYNASLYLAEVNFIDGQALDPTSFGETGDYGEWKPIEYTGSYGNNGFYLPFKQDYQVEGFSTVTYSGNGSTQYIGGTGFQPDFVWIKNRDSSFDYHNLYDSVRGTNLRIYSNATNAEEAGHLDSFDTDGFTLNTSNSNVNGSGTSYVAWSWDMGGSSVSNTDGSITSTVRANTTYGQSIVSYTGTGTAGATVGHGLSSAPEMIIVKPRSTTGGWIVYHDGIDSTAPEDYYINMDETGARSDNVVAWNDTAPTSSVFSLGSSSVVNGSGTTTIAYCFHSVTGYSKFGSYTGTGSTGNSVTTGFEPAFVVIKRTDVANEWYVMDNVRTDTQGRPHVLQANTAYAETTENSITFDSNGFTVDVTNNAMNASGGTYIYMAFADTREFAYWLDQSGNNNDWTSNNLTESDVSVDSPTNNFATLNSILPSATSTVSLLSEGNLKTTNGSISSDKNYHLSTMRVDSGKWYMEYYGTHSYTMGGVTYFDASSTENYNGSGGITYFGTQDEDYAYFGVTGEIYTNSSGTSYGATYGNGDIIGVALDLDSATNTVTFYKNNTSQGSYTLPSGKSWVFAVGQDLASNYHYLNFGQDSSFAGTKTAQGNTDDNEIGDFYYTPPSGYLALCTANLPDPDVIPSEHFNTLLYTGNATNGHSITGVGFQPDFTWIKQRGTADYHWLVDAVRGTPNTLFSNVSNAESSPSGGVQSFDSDGFTVGTEGGVNDSGGSFVAWNWKGANGTSSNTNGDITSTVSANQDAGFSIVSYTGDGTGYSSGGATIGHGLTAKPQMIIVKERSGASGWVVYTETTDATDYLQLDGYAATADYHEIWADTEPTSSVFTVGGAGNVNTNGDTYIAYCFHSVDGFSKFGTYVGNSSADGTFVYTGFRPAFVMVKSVTNNFREWYMFDNARDPDNSTHQYLRANTSSAEGTAGNDNFDFVSNGFKIRVNDTYCNSSSETYIYMCFAEYPFKYTNAR